MQVMPPRRLALVLVPALALLTSVLPLNASSAQEDESTGGDGAGVPELLAVGHGRAMGTCFAEIHTDGPWPPTPASAQRWVMRVTLQMSTGTIEIRSFSSHDMDEEGLKATTPDGRRLIVELVEVEEGILAYRWSCSEAPRTAEVLIEINDAEGRTVLEDRMEPHTFVDSARGPGDVPEAELVVDETGDLLSPGASPEDATSEAVARMGKGTSTTGALLLVALVIMMGWIAYMIWWDRHDPSVD